MDERTELVRLSQGRSGLARLLGPVAAVALAIAIVAAGLLGQETAPLPPSATTGATTAADAQPSSTAPGATSGFGSAADDVIVVSAAGYSVRYARHRSSYPSLFDGGRLAVYGFAGAFPFAVQATITVAAGTPAMGASLLGEGVAERIYADSLDLLARRYLEATDSVVASSESITVDGEDGVLLHSRGDPSPSTTTAAALLLARNRAFVISARGFDALPSAAGGESGNSSAQALRAFLSGMRFGPRLFVDWTLGFQVPQPVAHRPFGISVGRDASVSGLWVFDDGEQLDENTRSHSIAVSVGTEAHPALTRSLPSALPPPTSRRIWAATLSELVRVYRRVVDVGDGLAPVPVSLGGGDAVLTVRADGLAATVLAVHGGRVFLISTTGTSGPERAPSFERFLDEFAFLK